MNQCEWTIRWGATPECTTRCSRDEHVKVRQVVMHSDGRFEVNISGGDGNRRGDEQHRGPGLQPGQTITWQAGDRREYIGDWPGQCEYTDHRGQCTLPVSHHGHHAP